MPIFRSQAHFAALGSQFHGGELHVGERGAPSPEAQSRLADEPLRPDGTPGVPVNVRRVWRSAGPETIAATGEPTEMAPK